MTTSQAPGVNGASFEAAPSMTPAAHLHSAGPSLDVDPAVNAIPGQNGAPMHGRPADGTAGYTNGATSTHPLPMNGHAPRDGAATEKPNGGATNGEAANGAGGQCTAPQLRRFIKSRPYVPMHELRRRFGIVGDDDDVTAVKLELGLVYVGLPLREGGLLGELLRAGEIGYELSLDPQTPIVIGVYPMRPIPRN